MINQDRVRKMAIFCLFNKEELVNGEPPADLVVKVDGIGARFGFHKNKLESIREEVKEMINQLPDEFHQNKGGGMSFLKMCMLKDGTQWTGLHRTMEALMVLALGLELMHYVVERNLWPALPGGMPYLVIPETNDG